MWPIQCRQDLLTSTSTSTLSLFSLFLFLFLFSLFSISRTLINTHAHTCILPNSFSQTYMCIIHIHLPHTRMLTHKCIFFLFLTHITHKAVHQQSTLRNFSLLSTNPLRRFLVPDIIHSLLLVITISAHLSKIQHHHLRATHGAKKTFPASFFRAFSLLSYLSFSHPSPLAFPFCSCEWPAFRQELILQRAIPHRSLLFTHVPASAGAHDRLPASAFSRYCCFCCCCCCCYHRGRRKEKRRSG